MSIQIKKLTIEQTPLRVLIYGKSKIGKTSYAGTCPKPLVISADPMGRATLARLGLDVVEVNNMEDFEQAVSYALTDKDHETIVIDTLSYVCYKYINEQKENGKISLQMWGVMLDKLDQNLLKLREKLGKHLLVICEEQEQESTEDTMGVLYPVGLTKNQSKKLTYQYDIVGYMRLNEKGETIIEVKAKTNTVAGNRIFKPEVGIMPPDFNKLVQYYNSDFLNLNSTKENGNTSKSK